MKDIKKYYMLEQEDPDDYVLALVNYKKETNELSWQDIADIMCDKFGIRHSRQWYSANYIDVIEGEEECTEEDIFGTTTPISETDRKILELKKEKVKVADERNQNNAFIRRLAREETIIEIAEKCAAEMSGKKMLRSSPSIVRKNNEEENVLLISDWHYGFDFKNAWNTYNPEICKDRVSKLLKETIDSSKRMGVTKLHVVNMSDMIAGRIHQSIRYQCRIDVITQIMEVSEIIAEFLCELSKNFDVEYYACDDNHSRVEPDLSASLELESLCRITDWYLRERLKDCNIHFNDNEFGEDNIAMNILGHNIIAVHGDKDKPASAIQELSSFTGRIYEMVCMAHFHHFQSNENCDTLLICNGSLMGVDEYAKNLRLRSKPSQTLITVSRDNVAEYIHKINLD